jgi:hypothetical protein
MCSPMAYDRRALSDWSLTLIMFHVSAGQNEDKLCSFMIGQTVDVSAATIPDRLGG